METIFLLKLHLDGNTNLEQAEGDLESFLPLHTKDVVDYLELQPSLPAEQRSDFRELADLLRSLLHHQYRGAYERSIYTYAPLDPDRDRLLRCVPVPSERDRMVDAFVDEARVALRRAQYRRLKPEELQAALSAASRWGVRMRVRFSALSKLEVYARGRVVGSRKFRNWKRFFRQEEGRVELYQRLIVIFRVNEALVGNDLDPRRVYLRMFKNVPAQDVDMMLPATGIQMNWLDHSRIVVPSLYAVAITFWRFLRNVMLLALFGVFKSLALVVFALCAVGFGLRSMLTYRSATRQKYMLNMTKSLYYQNLDNNLGVVLRLLEEAEQQEASEVILAYFVVAQIYPSGAPDWDTVDRKAEELLQQLSSVEIDFDVHRACRALIELGILEPTEHGLRALPLNQALAALNWHWDSTFSR